MPTCANCTQKPCVTHDAEAYPGNCPSRTENTETVMPIYSEEEQRMLHEAALVESMGYCRHTRLEETMHFAYRLGYHKLGVAFCAGLSREALTLVKVLRSNGFETETVCCKTCSVPKEEIGIEDGQKVHPGQFEAMCNPGMQAELLDRAGCELNIVLGLCVGHDTVFFRHSKAPVTVLSPKDRVMAHNPMGAIYTADGHTKRVYHFIETLKKQQEEEH